RPLLEWLWRQPAAFKDDRHHAKTALRDAVRDVLPAGLLTNRPKRGFTLPFALWMKKELRPFLEDTFATTSVARRGLFDTTAVQKTWRGFLAHDAPREWSRVWSLAVLVAFVNQRGSSASVPPVEPAATRVNPNAISPATPATRSEDRAAAKIRSRTLLLAPEI